MTRTSASAKTPTNALTNNDRKGFDGARSVSDSVVQSNLEVTYAPSDTRRFLGSGDVLKLRQRSLRHEPTSARESMACFAMYSTREILDIIAT